MPHDVISTCPVCSSELAVTRLHCRSCGTTLEGDFSVGRFGRLSREQLALLESFLRSRGNLRDMERELGSATRRSARASRRSSGRSASGRAATTRIRTTDAAATESPRHRRPATGHPRSGSPAMRSAPRRPPPPSGRLGGRPMNATDNAPPVDTTASATTASWPFASPTGTSAIRGVEGDTARVVRTRDRQPLGRPRSIERAERSLAIRQHGDGPARSRPDARATPGSRSRSRGARGRRRDARAATSRSTGLAGDQRYRSASAT